jgi:FkbM family methyltransferase
VTLFFIISKTRFMSNNLKNIFEEITRLSNEDQHMAIDMLQHYLSATNELNGILNKPVDYHKKVAEVSFFTRKMLGPYTKALLIDTQEGLYATDPEDYEVGWRLRKEGKFEPEQLNFLKGMINAESKVLVVGAHIGTIAIPLSRICAYTAAIEANPDTFRLLELNIKLNNLKNCDAFNIAANDESKDISFLISKSNSGGSKRKPIVDQYIYNYDSPEEIKIPGVSLDEYFNGQTFDLIIMDIEGSEYFALKGMRKLLSAASILVIEFLPHHLKNISGVTVNEFLSTLPPYKSLTVPSLNKKAAADEFQDVLNYMYDNNMDDNAIIFKRDE